MSFGERLATRIFASYLRVQVCGQGWFGALQNKMRTSAHVGQEINCDPGSLCRQGVPARQYDAWDLGMTTTDDFTNADVLYEETLPKIKASASCMLSIWDSLQRPLFTLPSCSSCFIAGHLEQQQGEEGGGHCHGLPGPWSEHR